MAELSDILTILTHLNEKFALEENILRWNLVSIIDKIYTKFCDTDEMELEGEYFNSIYRLPTAQVTIEDGETHQVSTCYCEDKDEEHWWLLDDDFTTEQAFHLLQDFCHTLNIDIDVISKQTKHLVDSNSKEYIESLQTLAKSLQNTKEQ